MKRLARTALLAALAACHRDVPRTVSDSRPTTTAPSASASAGVAVAPSAVASSVGPPPPSERDYAWDASQKRFMPQGAGTKVTLRSTPTGC